MRITVAQRLRPFSHIPGERCLIPGTLLSVQVFPALLVVYNMAAGEPVEIARHQWNVSGPVKDFTIQQDLEKGCVVAWGHAAEGFFRYRIGKSGSSYAIEIEKAPEKFGSVPSAKMEYPEISRERLSLGVDKQQDWTLVRRRLSIAEILPFWLHLGNLTPPTPATREGAASLLEMPDFEKLFMAGFDGILCPRLADRQHQGFNLPPVTGDFSPAILLTEGAGLIRSQFFRQHGNEMHLLLSLPHEFSSGRFINVRCGAAGEIDLEWRSRKLRRAIFRCAQSGGYTFVFPKQLKSFRFREQDNVRGALHLNGSIQEYAAGHTYLFDLFET